MIEILYQERGALRCDFCYRLSYRVRATLSGNIFT